MLIGRKESSGSHTVEIKKRQTGRVTGVKEVDSFSEEEILLQTEEGRLRGWKGFFGLHMPSLDKGRNPHNGRADRQPDILPKEGDTGRIFYEKAVSVRVSTYINREVLSFFSGSLCGRGAASLL